jgi:hypothetical protein
MVDNLPAILQADTWPLEYQQDNDFKAISPQTVTTILKSIASGEQIRTACVKNGVEDISLITILISKNTSLMQFWLNCLKMRAVIRIPLSDDRLDRIEAQDGCDPAAVALRIKAAQVSADYSLRVAERLLPQVFGSRQAVDITSVSSSTVRHVVDAGALDARDISQIVDAGD